MTDDLIKVIKGWVFQLAGAMTEPRGMYTAYFKLHKSSRGMQVYPMHVEGLLVVSGEVTEILLTSGRSFLVECPIDAAISRLRNPDS